MYYIFIADIHGMILELEDALNRSHDFMRSVGIGTKGYKFVFGGDLIDRGFEHTAVINLVKWNVITREDIVLYGNHDMMMVGTADGTTYRGNDGRDYQYYEMWDENDGLVTAMQMFGNIGVDSTKKYANLIRESSEYEFLKTHARYFYETDSIYFCHAPQSKLDITEQTLIWGRSKDYSNSKGDAAFLVPNNKMMSVHGHIHWLHRKVNFPRIHHYTHGGLNKTVVLADSGCGCGYRGRLHPVILKDNGNDRPEVFAIL